ncbi:hypothetical protein NQ317_011400 [Molorchus minor]|uniref:Uncharacterized protein n=1 Tax=Molorchus minor TaxID=1323400 RepID=A0ABQ9IXV1_9CUCU|nr:hypothetical protein NQ317_011400 [Molorchus minor]
MGEGINLNNNTNKNKQCKFSIMWSNKIASYLKSNLTTKKIFRPISQIPKVKTIYEKADIESF